MTSPTPDARAKREETEREIAHLRSLADRCWQHGGKLYRAGFYTITGEERALLLLDHADRLEAETLTEKSDER